MWPRTSSAQRAPRPSSSSFGTRALSRFNAVATVNVLAITHRLADRIEELLLRYAHVLYRGFDNSLLAGVLNLAAAGRHRPSFRGRCELIRAQEYQLFVNWKPHGWYAKGCFIV